MSTTMRSMSRVAAAFLLLSLFSSLAFASASAATQSTLTFLPVADAEVMRSQPDSNFGNLSSLRARSLPAVRSYLRFSVSGLGGLPISRARLLVFATSSSGDPLVARAIASNSWGETAITYNNAPALGTVIRSAPSVSAGTWVSIDVTSYIRSAGTYTIALVSPGTNPIIFYSREAGSPAPRLVLTLSNSASSTSSTIKHVFVVVMENKGYSQVWNRSSTPYITQLGKSYALATNYHATGHPSLPDYLEMYAGSKYGISNDCSPSSSCHINARSLADNLDAKGLKWRAYMESMPAPCYIKTSGSYAPKHNPFVYFDNIRNNAARCNNHVVSFNALAGDLSSRSTTPNYAFISPNQCSDMHDCSVATGDNWLKAHLPAILNSAACKVDTCLLILTWDEDDGGSGNHVLTIFAGSGAKLAATSSASYTHYSLLRTVESIFGLPTQTTNDAAASVMKDMLR